MKRAGAAFNLTGIGSLNGGLDPIPVEVSIIEMDPDCTGKFRYSINLPGEPAETVVEERFVAFDNGSEYRSVPSFIDASGVPTLAWLGFGRRIRRATDPVNPCGPQTAYGTYMITAENIVPPSPNAAFADTIVFRMDISMTSEYTGMLYEKLGPLSVELPVFGTFTVNPDCSFAWDLIVQGLPGSIGVWGVFFNAGKELYGLAIDPNNEGIKNSFAQGMRISQSSRYNTFLRTPRPASKTTQAAQ